MTPTTISTPTPDPFEPDMVPIPSRMRLQLPPGYPWPLPDAHGRTPQGASRIVWGLPYYEIRWGTRSGRITRTARMYAKNHETLLSHIQDAAWISVTGSREPDAATPGCRDDREPQRELGGMSTAIQAIAWPLPEYVADTGRVIGMLDPAQNAALGGPPWPVDPPAETPCNAQVVYPSTYTGPRDLEFPGVHRTGLCPY